MKLHVWRNKDGLHLSRPKERASLTEIEFAPKTSCRQCGEHVLSVSADNSDICPWCESNVNRPKMLAYQEEELLRLLKQQSDTNAALRRKRRPLIRNGYTEKDLRNYLTAQGYRGNSAEVISLELRGLERPGWVQLFEFHVQARDAEGDWRDLRGTCRTDERSSLFEVTFFSSHDNSNQLAAATEGMITSKRTVRHWSYWPLMILFFLLLAAAVTGAVLTEDEPPYSGMRAGRRTALKATTANGGNPAIESNSTNDE